MREQSRLSNQASLQQPAEKNIKYPSRCTWWTSDQLPAVLLSLLLGLLWQRTNRPEGTQR